jgi:tRNA-dihydrouridine synthase
MPQANLRLGNQSITPPLMLAPMMDVTNQAFRALVRYYGGCGLFYTEMLNSRRIPGESLKSPLWKGLGIEQDVMVQLLGDDTDALVRSMEKLLPLNPFGFDWNLGCAKKKIMCWGWGAELLTHPARVAKVLQAMRKVTSRPLTVKIRIPNEFEAAAFIKFLEIFEDEGVDAVTVHARMPKDGFKRPARWDKIVPGSKKICVFR